MLSSKLNLLYHKIFLLTL